MNNKDIFFNFLGKKIDIVSSVDHPYTSPPIHLFDAHLNLLQKYGDSVLILNWDVSLPGDRTYRYDLITDTGLIAKTPDLYHYKLEIPYCIQSFDKKPWELLPSCIEIASDAIGKKHHLPKNTLRQIRERASTVLDLTQKSYNAKPWLFTRKLLINLYSLLNKPELSIFIEKQYANYWLSPIMIKWIPWCILNIDGPLSFSSLLQNGTFLRNPLRTIDPSLSNIEKQSSFTIAEKISSGSVIPSFDIFLWSLAVAEIRHYGNDFGFFQKLSEITGIKTIADLQLTKSGEDASRFLKLSTDYATLLSLDQNERATISSSAYHSSKATRINSFCSLYVIGGSETIDYLKNYSRSSLLSEKIISLS